MNKSIQFRASAYISMSKYAVWILEIHFTNTDTIFIIIHFHVDRHSGLNFSL